MFHDYLARHSEVDPRRALIDLFLVLDQKPEDRDPYENASLLAFPYVNGGLFADEHIEIPRLSEEIVNLLLRRAAEPFNWAEISPTIFGAVFESTLNPETRRSGGMHYTSIENIHKVIDPLFLDDLRAELEEIKALAVPKTRNRRLLEFQEKLGQLTFLDPACGSGNFLTETYLSLRRLENEALSILQRGQIAFGDLEGANPIKVSIGQFYGIEINDFAVTVAKTALWIAESQMLKETEDVVQMSLDFLPLKTYANIAEGNALRMDWESVIPAQRLNYIMGNPPFVGYKFQTSCQKKDLMALYTAKNIDYVAGWFYKAAEMMNENRSITAAFVATNSITQGEQVDAVWGSLYQKFKWNIEFAYRTFEWASESLNKAHVHCVIVGFSLRHDKLKKTLFESAKEGTCRQVQVDNINAYLLPSSNIFIKKRASPICDVPPMIYGSEPREGGNLILSSEEREALLRETPDAISVIKRFVSSEDFLNNKIRYCLWITPNDFPTIRKSKKIMKRLADCKAFREKSKQLQAHQSAERPWQFTSPRQPESAYLLIPVVSSQNRRYIPIGYMDKDVIASNACFTIPNATLYAFGVIESNVHMAWMRTVCGRLKSDYRYSNTLVYNNFPWPSPDEKQRARIEETARAILDARALYPEASLAAIYDELTMPPELRKAHQANDLAVMQAYGFDVKMTEAECVGEVMNRYNELVLSAKC